MRLPLIGQPISGRETPRGEGSVICRSSWVDRLETNKQLTVFLIFAGRSPWEVFIRRFAEQQSNK